MAKKRVGKFPKAFRQMAVDRLTQCDNIVALEKELGISRCIRGASSSSRWSAAKAPQRPRGNRLCGTR